MNIPIPQDLRNFLQAQNAFLVGGAVRDHLLDPKAQLQDFDFVIFDLPDLEGFSRDLANQTASAFVPLDRENGVFRLVNERWQADLTLPRGADLLADLRARDFSVNAIAFDLQSNTILDPLNGKRDLEDKRLRVLSADAFAVDPLRMLRAYRIAAQQAFVVDSSIESLVAKHLTKIDSVAKERISSEIWLLLGAQHSFVHLRQALEVGLWERIFPEFQALRQVPPNDFHHLPLIEHTFELVRQYENYVSSKLPSNALDFIQSEKLSGVSLEALLKMGCLLHDIAKPDTWKIVDCKHTFYGHEKLGAETTSSIARRLLWSKSITSLLKILVELHLRPFQVAPIQDEPSQKAERRFFRRSGSVFYPLMALAWADLLSTRGPMVSETIITMSENRLLGLCERYESFIKEDTQTPPLLSGTLLKQAIDQAKLPASKQIKILLGELRELQMSGHINTTEEAYQWFINSAKEKLSD